MNHLVIKAVLAGAALFLVFPGVQSLAAAQGPARATGVAQVVLSDREDSVCGNSCAQRMTINAISLDDGGAVGQFDLFSEEGGGVRLHGSITCLRVDGNVAQLGGVVTESDLADLIGLRVTWLVVDNGEGKNAPADQSSDLFGNRDCESDIVSHPRFELFDVTKGNIQVGD